MKVFGIAGHSGMGKTTLLERLVKDLGEELSLAVIEGDQASDRDAARVRAAGGRVVQIKTVAVCHLDAHGVGHAPSSSHRRRARRW